MGWWQRWGAYVGAAVLAGATFLPRHYSSQDERLRLEDYPVEGIVAVNGTQCVPSAGFEFAYVPKVAHVQLSAKDRKSLEDVIGQSMERAHVAVSLSPNQRRLIFYAYEPSTTDPRAEIVGTSGILDRDTGLVRQPPNYPGFQGLLGWHSSDHVRVLRMQENERRDYVWDLEKGSLDDITLRTKPWAHALLYYSLLALLAFGTVARQKLVAGQGGRLTRDVCAPFHDYLEEWIGAFVGSGASLIGYVALKDSDPLSADNFARFAPLAVLQGTAACAIYHTLSKYVRAPVPLNVVQGVYYLVRAKRSEKLSESTVNGCGRYLSRQLSLLVRANKHWERGEHSSYFACLDEVSRLPDDTHSLMDVLVSRPMFRFSRFIPGFPRRSESKSFEMNRLGDITTYQRVGEHDIALQKWKSLLADYDGPIPLVEMKAGLGRYLTALESLAVSDSLSRVQLRCLGRHLRVASEKGAIAGRIGADARRVWSEVVAEMLREGSGVARQQIGHSANTVFEFTGDYLLPHALILKMGTDRQRLEKEYRVTRELARRLPHLRVSRPLYFDGEKRPVLLVERVNGRTLAETNDENWVSLLARALGDLHTKGEKIPRGTVGTYDCVSRIKERIEPMLNEIGVSIPDGYRDAIAVLAKGPQGLLHGDCTPMNAMLYGNVMQGKDVSFIDMEKAVVGPVVKDIGCFLAHHATPCIDTAEFVETYRRESPAARHIDAGDFASLVRTACLHEWIRQTAGVLRWRTEGMSTESEARCRFIAASTRMGYVLDDAAFSQVRPRNDLLGSFVLRVNERVLSI